MADETTVAAVNPQEKLVTLVEKLVERVEKLEQGRIPTNERPTAERRRPWDVNAAETHSQRSAEPTGARRSERARTPVASRPTGFGGCVGDAAKEAMWPGTADWGDSPRETI